MHIFDLRTQNQDVIRQAAALLVEGFRDDWPDVWPDKDAALAEVNRSVGWTGSAEWLSMTMVPS